MSPAHVTMKKKAVFLSIAFFLALLFVVGPAKPYAGRDQDNHGPRRRKGRHTVYSGKDSLSLLSGLRQDRHAQ